jgi:putative MATE family efflux protein
MEEKNLTEGSILKNLIWFSLPYLLSCFLQTFYGLADLFITGQFNDAATISAVSVGSQVTHMLTVILVGLAMGSTVTIGRAIGAGKAKEASRSIGNTVLLFTGFSLVLTVLLLLFCDGILSVLSVPEEALVEAKRYLMICFAGVPFITAYNVISSIFRGLGDSKRPMYFVAIAGVLNVGLDYLLIGPFAMGAAGAALATVTSQILSVVMSLLYMKLRMNGLSLAREDFQLDRNTLSTILKVGLPIAFQDGFIQIAFLVITVIANRRGVDVAAAVGIVEKVISFLFLVPSAMLSSVSAISAQNAGAGLHERSRKTLLYATAISVGFGILFTILCQFQAERVLLLFAKDEPEVITMGAQYLRAYVFDCIVAGVHFCFSGYFCAYQKSFISFAHNLASILLVRIPGAYLASVYYPDSLFPMGLAAPLGSLLSAVICVCAYLLLKRKFYNEQM